MAGTRLNTVRRHMAGNGGPGPMALAILLFASAALLPGLTANGDDGMGGGMGRSHSFFMGQVESLPASGLIGVWSVAGKTVQVSADTEIRSDGGPIAVGSTVMVEGLLQPGGSVNAKQIVLKDTPGDGKKTISFCGIIESLPGGELIGSWTVSGVIVHVDASTTVDETRGAASVRVAVRVKGDVQPDLSVSAREVVVNEATCGGFNQPASMTFTVLHLKPANDAPEGAEGVVITRKVTFVDGNVREDLKVAVEHLLPKTTHDVTIDSFQAGAIMTNDEGEGHLFLSTAGIPGAEALPPELQDFGAFQQVEISAGSTAVLTGSFADAEKVVRDHPEPDFLAVAILKDGASRVLGMATAWIMGDEQGLVLTVWSLKPGEQYTLEVDTTTVGDLAALEHGRIQAEYSSTTGGEGLPLPAALDPVSALVHLELRDSGDTAVVSGDFQSVVRPEPSLIKRAMKRNLRH